MKVLLVADIDKVGWLGDIVEVKTGYARNYLLPQGLATLPIEANLRALSEEKAKRAEQRIRHRKRLEAAAEAVEGAEVVIAAKANEQGHLFGSVGASDIAGNLREQGFEVADEVVELSENIKQVGTSTVQLKFSDDLRATITATVVRESDDTREAEASAEQVD